MKKQLILLSALLCFVFCYTSNVQAQRPQDLAERAMSAGKYEDAIKYYQQAYEITQDDTFTQKINLAQTLKTEFDAVDQAIKAGRFEDAEAHLANVLMVDPTNIFVEKQRERIKDEKSHEKKRRTSNKFQRLTRGFRGSWEKHDNLGGLHFELGGAFGNFETPFTVPELSKGLRARLYYANYKAFPFSLDVNLIALGHYQSIGGGIGSAITLSDNCAFTYGVGYQRNYYMIDSVQVDNASNPYYSVGLTYMFDNEHLGGISYSYNHSIGNKERPAYSHNITYIFGKGMSAYIGILSVLVGLSVVGQLLK